MYLMKATRRAPVRESLPPCYIRSAIIMYDILASDFPSAAVSGVMETLQFHPYLTVAGMLLALWGLKHIGVKKPNPNRLPRPPGPKGLPILGAMLEMPPLNDKPWLAYDEMFQKYGAPRVNIWGFSLIYIPGDMIYFEVLGQPFLVLGSLKRINDILDKRSSNYSDRLIMPMVKLYGPLSPNVIFREG